MTNLSCTQSSSGSPSDQERIDRIKARLAALDRKPEPEFADLKVSQLTDAEMAALAPDLPKSHRDLLKQIGTIVVGFGHEVPTASIHVPMLWENSYFGNGRPPQAGSFLCVAWDGDSAAIYGYEINQRPHELVATHCIDFGPYKCDEGSLLDLTERFLGMPRSD
jgi:hypothetical protein